MDEIKRVRISTIKIGKQFREDMGDLEELAASIEECLLQPIGITSKRELVFGYRRLTACRDILGWKTILARTVDVPSILSGMLTENVMRKDFTVSERVAIFQAIKEELGDRQGQRTDLGTSDNFAKVEPGQRTDEFAAKRSGLGNRKTAAMAESVVTNGTPKLVEAMDSGEISISAAAEVADLPKREQRAVLEKGCDHGKLVAREIRTYKQQARFQAAQKKVAGKVTPKTKWKVTADQRAVKCQLLVVDPPYGITNEPWEPDDLEEYTRAWASKWASCEADFVAIFFSQQYMWDARRWFDESLKGYEFQQMLVWHASNNMSPKARQDFKQSWEPIFLYRRKGCDRLVHDHGSSWTGELHDFDCHVAPVPQANFGGEDHKQHPCQKPVSTMKWLVNALSNPGHKVASLFCGVAPCGIAALQLGREYHGVEVNKKYVKLAEERLAAYGVPDRNTPNGRKLKINSVVQGDCMELIQRLRDQSVNCVVTSPPYSQKRKGFYDGVPDRLYPEFTARWMDRLRSKLTGDGNVLLVIDPDVSKGVVSDYVLRTQLLLREHGWKQHRTLIWHKPDVYPLGHKWWPRHCYEQILWFSQSDKPYCDPWAAGLPSDRLSVNGYSYSKWSAGKGEQRNGVARVTDIVAVPSGADDKGIDHPAKFPVALAEVLIRTFCPKSGTVLDPFCGSGSTLLAAKKLKRDFYGFDVESEYVELARKRLAAVNRNGARRKERAG